MLLFMFLAQASTMSCSDRLDEAFLPWSSLSKNCKRSLHLRNKRWHDRAMQLEKEDAIRVCSRFPDEYSFEDVHEIFSNLKDYIHKNSIVCPYPYFPYFQPPPPPSSTR